MDPGKALVHPATIIIRDPKVHADRPVHRRCRAPQYINAFRTLYENGEVDDALLQVLLSHEEHVARRDAIAQWMARLSLLVPVQGRSGESSADTLLPGETRYLVPALLPKKEGAGQILLLTSSRCLYIYIYIYLNRKPPNCPWQVLGTAAGFGCPPPRAEIS